MSIVGHSAAREFWMPEALAEYKPR